MQIEAPISKLVARGSNLFHHLSIILSNFYSSAFLLLCFINNYFYRPAGNPNSFL